MALATGLIEIVLTYSMALTVDRLGRLPYLKLGFVVALLGAGLGVVVTSVLHFTPWPILFVVVGALLGLTFGPRVLFALIAVLMVAGLLAVSVAGIETRQRVLEEVSA